MRFFIPALAVLILGAVVTTLAMEGARQVGPRPSGGMQPFVAMVAGLLLTVLALGFVIVTRTLMVQS